MGTVKEFYSQYEIVQLWMTSKENEGRRGNRFALSEQTLRKARVLMESSEMSRILQTVNPDGWTKPEYGRPFTADLLALDVRSVDTYGELMVANSGVIYLNEVAYRLFLCADGHAREKKAFFVRKAIWDTATRLLCCVREWQGKYPPSKLRAYLGKAATPSKPILLDELPYMAVLPDYCQTIEPWASMVWYSVTKAGGRELAQGYTVEPPFPRKTKVNLFDGAGLIDYDTAKRFADELGLNYVPSVFQIRLSPGVKGCLFTFPLKKFWREYAKEKWEQDEKRERTKKRCRPVRDAWGKIVEEPGELEVILLESQFKLKKTFTSFEHWAESFQTPNEGYRYTFNISDVSPQYGMLPERIKLSYQALQTLELTREEICQLAQPTVDTITRLHSDARELCTYMGLADPAEHDKGRGMRSPVFEALAKEPALLGDDYVMDEVRRQLLRIKKEAYIGKLLVRGCYSHLVPDLVALAEYAFGLKPKGVLKEGECYSYYWNRRHVKEVDAIRFPHLGNEHCVMQCVRTPKATKWFCHQESSFILNIHDTTAKILGGADFDGDKALTTCDPVLLAAAKRDPAVTVLYEPWPKFELTRRGNLLKSRRDPTEGKGECGPRDVVKLSRADCAAMNCDVGTPANQTTILWSAEKSPERDRYIQIMQAVGSLTIDSVKTAVTAKIPPEIAKFISRIEKPYFLRYRKGEDQPEKCMGRQTSTMNLVCFHMEEQLKGLRASYTPESFSYQMLMGDPRERDTRGAAYRKVKEALLRFWEEYSILAQNLEQKSGASRNRRYRAFFQRFRTALQKEFAQAYLCTAKKGQSEIDELLDIVIQLYYTDEDMIAAGVRSRKLLWQAFGPELIARVRNCDKSRELSGDTEASRIIRKRTDRVKRKKQEALEHSKFHLVEPVPVYAGTIAEIKKRTKDPISRKILVGLVVLSRAGGGSVVFRKGSRDELTETAFCTAVGITLRQWRDRQGKLIAAHLMEAAGDVSAPEGMRVTASFSGENGRVLKYISSIDDLNQLCGKVGVKDKE